MPPFNRAVKLKQNDQRHRRQPITGNRGQEEQHILRHVSSAVEIEIETLVFKNLRSFCVRRLVRYYHVG
jgi:hypothetical protein